MVITYHRQKTILIFLVHCLLNSSSKKNKTHQHSIQKRANRPTADKQQQKQKDPTHKVITYHRQRGSQSHTDIPRTSPVRSPAPGRGRRATRGSSTRAGTRTGTRLSGTRTPSGARTAKPNTPPSAQCRQPKALKSTVK